jgi:hypothetical protein
MQRDLQMMSIEELKNHKLTAINYTSHGLLA